MLSESAKITWIVPQHVPDDIIDKQVESIVLPNYITTAREWTGPVDTAFLCLSSSWVPPWMDDQFYKLIDSFPGETIEFQAIEKRHLNMDDVNMMIDNTNIVLENTNI